MYYDSYSSYGYNFYGGFWGGKCHNYKEILPNFLIGTKYDVEDFIKKENVDVLIPLDSLTGKIWEWGFTGEIFYFPIEDYYILPEEAEINLVQKIVNYLSEGKRIAMFCIGGHGRTGYIASLVLGYEGISDPIGYLRENYCSHAIESTEQVEAISDFMGDPSLYYKYKPKPRPKLQSWVKTGVNYNTPKAVEKPNGFVNIGGQVVEAEVKDVPDDEDLQEEEVSSYEDEELERKAKNLGLTVDEYLEYLEAFQLYYERDPVDDMELYEGYWLKQFK